MPMGLGLGLGLGRGGASGYTFVNAEAAAVSAAMLAAGSEPEDTRKALIDTLVGALKTATIWTSLDLFYMHAAHSAAAALINWKSPGTFDAIAVNSPAFTADRGYISDTSTSRLRTQYTPNTHAVNLQQDNGSNWVWSLNSAGSAASVTGNATAPRISIVPRNTSDQQQCRMNDNDSALRTSLDATGFFGISRPAAGTKRVWQQGVQQGADVSVASTGLPTQEQWICGANATFFSPLRVAAAIWADSLSGKEAALYTALYNYLHDASVGAV